jgi:glycosyltransferase involved in cell wall biosynthesis
MASILRDPDLAQRLGSAARRRAQDFDLERVTRQYEALYEEVLGASSGH